MCQTDKVHTHVFQQLHIPAVHLIRKRYAHRHLVLMTASSHKFQGFPIQFEAFLRIHAEPADPKGHVSHLSTPCHVHLSKKLSRCTDKDSGDHSLGFSNCNRSSRQTPRRHPIRTLRKDWATVFHLYPAPRRQLQPARRTSRFTKVRAHWFLPFSSRKANRHKCP